MKRALEQDTSGRGKYNEYTPEERGQIGKFATEHGPTKAVRHFSKLLSRKVPETMARRLKAEIFLGTWPMTVPLHITATAYGSLLLSLSRLHDNSSPTLGCPCPLENVMSSNHSFLYTAQPPYLHFDTSIEHSNWADRSGYVYTA